MLYFFVLVAGDGNGVWMKITDFWLNDVIFRIKRFFFCFFKKNLEWDDLEADNHNVLLLSYSKSSQISRKLEQKIVNTKEH